MERDIQESKIFILFFRTEFFGPGGGMKGVQ
jgi:hypothetical protein